MNLLYTDDSALDPNKHPFFVYGGISVPGGNALWLHQEIERLRTKHCIKPGYILKFNPTPEGISQESFNELKGGMITAAAKAGCRFYTTVVLNDIAQKDIQKSRRWAIERILFGFNSELRTSKTHGIVLIDRFKDTEMDRHMLDLFSIGNKNLPYSKESRHERILGIHFSFIGQSHFCSLVDVILGSFRLLVDLSEKKAKAKPETAIKLAKLLSPLFVTCGSKGPIAEISITFNPKVIKHGGYLSRYNTLKDYLKSIGLNTAQPITSERQY